MKDKERFSYKLRKLREEEDLSLKNLAKVLDVNYTYISKIENDKSTPSEAFIKRIATLFNCDFEELKVSAGKIPEDIIEIIRDNPREAIEYLRREFGGKGDRS